MGLGSKYAKGIEIEMGGNTTKLKNALDGANKDIKATQSELDTLQNKLNLKWDPASFTRAQELAQRSVQQTREKADILKKALAELDKQGAGKNTEQYEAIRRELSYVEAAAQKAEGKLNDINNLRFDSLKKTLDEVGSRLNTMGNALTLGATAPLVAAGAAAVNYASDTSESLNKVDVAFSYASEGVRRWSDTTLTSLGLAKGTALDMAALYGDMATSMGYNSAEAAKMSMELVGLSADLASFKNIGIDQATNALKGVFTGEGESLKSLGVIMTDTNLKAYALAQGYTVAYDKMNQAQKVAVRYNYVLEQTKNAQGDFARTSDGTANQLRIFQESLKEAAATAGNELLPIITPIITQLSSLIQSFGQLDEGTRKAVVQTALFVATLGPMLKITGGITTVVGAGVAAYMALTGAKAADTVATTAQAAATTTATAAQTGLNVAMFANPIVAVVGAIGMLVAVLGGFAITAALTTESTEDFNQKLNETAEATDAAVKSIESDTAAKLANLRVVEQIIPEIELLNSKTGRTSEEQAKLNSLVSAANKLYPGLIGDVDGLTGSYRLNTDALRDNIEQKKAQLQAESYLSIAAENYRTAADLTMQLAEKQEILDDATARRTAKEEELIAAYGEGKVTMEQMKDALLPYAEAAASAGNEVLALQLQIDGYNEKAEEAINATSGVTSSADEAGESMADLAGQTGLYNESAEEHAKRLKELSDATSGLVGETETLSAAFAEQSQNGSLSIDTVLRLIDAGYAAALVIDEETGSVRLNAEAYATLAQKKIEEQISGLQDEQRANKIRLLEAETKATSDDALANAALALAYQQQADAIKGELADSEAMIATLNNLKSGLGNVVTGNWSSKAPATPRKSSGGSSKKEETQEEKNVKAFKAAMEERDYLRSMDRLSEADYYLQMEALRDQYLTVDGDEWRDATVKLHEYKKEAYDRDLKALDKSLSDGEITTEQHLERLRELQAAQLVEGSEDWKENQKAQKADWLAIYNEKVADQEYFHDMGLTSDANYYRHLEELRDQYLEKDSEEWRKATLTLHKWQEQQDKDAADARKKVQEQAQKDAEAAEKRRTDLIKQYTDERIAYLKKEQEAEEDKINAAIDGINDEIAARRRLREEESDEDAISKAQKTLEAAKGQLAFARDADTRAALEKEVKRAQDAYDKALQEKEDNDWYYQKEQEIKAKQDELEAVRDKYQDLQDAAGDYAANRVAAEEAAAERRRAAEEEKRKAENAFWDKEIARLEAEAAGKTLSAAEKSVAQAVNNAVNSVVNNNKVAVSVAAPALSPWELAQGVGKALDKLASK